MLRVVLGSLRIVVIGVTAALIVLGSIQFFDYYQDRQASADIGTAVRIKVSERDTNASFARDLKKKGLIERTWVFENYLRVSGDEVIPGIYQLYVGMSAFEIADVVSGKSTPTPPKEDKRDDDQQDEAQIITISVPEGWRTEQIAEELVAQGWQGTVEDFMGALKNFDTSGYEFLESRDNSENPESLEGFLFPDTYEIVADVPADHLIQLMLDNFNQKFNEEMRNRASQMNLSVYDVLIFASLVEREARIGEERPYIADVYLNRFEQGMKFDADPTVQYAIGKRDDNWWSPPTPEDLQTVDSPYNTYLNTGMPPGPICNPGLASIQAVLEPGGTEYLFFLLKDPETGEHVFANTYEEHLANQDLYINGGGGGESEEQPPSEEEVPIEQSGG